jgi:GNAT superfamily N-acetyltransferase
MTSWAIATSNQPRFRHARASDEDAIAALHAESWRHAYRGLLPDAYVDHDVFADRAALWRQRFGEPERQLVTVTIVAERDDGIIGFAHSVADDDPEWGTLLDNLHVRFDAQRLGIATRLVAETARWLQQHAVSPGLHLWVLEGNARARRFYDALGGRITGRGVSSEGGGSAPCLRYSWSRIGALAGDGSQA